MENVTASSRKYLRKEEYLLAQALDFSLGWRAKNRRQYTHFWVLYPKIASGNFAGKYTKRNKRLMPFLG